MESLKQLKFKYLMTCSLIVVITSISYFAFDEIYEALPKNCNETVISTITIVEHQKSDEKRLKYWPAEFGERISDESLRSMNRVFSRLNYEFVDGFSNDWDVLWTIEHAYYSDDPLNLLTKPLKPHQKVNHFPGNNALVGKSRMTTRNKHLKYIKPAFRTESYDELMQYIKANPDKKFVQKNKYNRGVQIVNASDIVRDLPDTFYQVFLDNPLIIEKRALDLGVFVLITSVNPLRVYRFNEEVLLRFCPEDYYPFDETNRYKYVVDSSHTSTYELSYFGDAYEKYKCTFKSLFEGYIEQKGFNVQKLWKEIDEAIASIVLNSEKPIIDELKDLSLSSKNFFELVRFDVILDEDLNPFIMEVNMSPNLTPAHPRFEENALIYEQLIYNTVNMIGGGSHFEFMSRYNNDTTLVNNKNVAVHPEQCLRNDCINNCHEYECRLCLPCLSEEQIFQMKEAYREHSHIGNFNRVFPTKNHFNDRDLKWKVTENNRLMIDWYREKCRQNRKWC